MVNLSKIFFFVVFFFVFVPIISAVCEDNQIDINLASLEKLDELVGVGPAYAEQIINLRPFESVDELVKVSGIAERRLANIKAQGLACVDGETSEESDAEEEIIIEERETIEEPDVIDYQVDSSIEEDENIEIVLDKKVETISLNSQVVEEENLVYNSKNAQVVDYLVYGFAVFLIFVVGFLIWERR